MRYTIFSLLFVACVIAVSLGSLLPGSVFRTSAQNQKFKSSTATQPGQTGQAGEPLSASALQQIQALMEEKASRTPAQKKMDSSLIYSIKMDNGEAIADGVETLAVNVPRTVQGDVVVDITAKVNDNLLAKLRNLGANIVSSFPRYNTIRAEVDLSSVDAIANLSEVIYVQPMQEGIVWQADEPLQRTRPGFEERERNISQQLAKALDDFQLNVYTTPNGGVRKSEADVTHKALLARNTYGPDGTGVKIGVVSDGVRNLAAVQASGDLGPVTVLPGQTGLEALPGRCTSTIACDEGTAMLELVHDIAPGAQLYFATGRGGPATMAQNILDLRAAGCDIIVDDLFYFAESPFQDGQAPSVISPNNQGIVAQAVNDVTADGALYFSSAGNSGNKNDNTSGNWEGDFVDGGAAPSPPYPGSAGQFHQFPADGVIPAQNFNTVTTASGPLSLNWSDPMGGATNDYDLYVLNSTGTTVLASSTTTQNGTQDPLEFINATLSANLRIVVVKFSGVSRFLHVSLSRGRIAVNTPGITSGHSVGANAFSVAATPAVGPYPNPFSAANVVETFSSDGPRRLFYQADGTPFTPGNVSSTGGIVRQKPDITAADGASVTGAGGFGIQFFGTSAAAPHAAAIAALLKSANPALTPAQVRTALTTSAIDIEGAGVDRDSGVGIIMADTALGAIGAVSGAANLTIGTATITDIAGNVNGYIEPGERATLDIPLNNTGINPATAVTATLSSTTPGVVITPSATRPYADIPATSGTSTNATPFEFVYQEGATYAANITFVLTVTYNGGIVRSFPFFVPTGQLALISGTLDATPTASGSNYVATTGTQTGRLNFTFPIASCGSPKTPPTTVATGARRYDAYTFINTGLTPICAQILLTHSANALIHAVAYTPAFVPATTAVGYAGDGGGSATSGAGTTQLFSINVPAGASFTVVVSESNVGGAPNVPYNLRVTGLPAGAVPANQPPVNSVPGTQAVLEDGSLTFSSGGGNQVSISDPDAGNNVVETTLTVTDGLLTLAGTTGLSFSAGDGTSDATMTFQGSITDINNAMNGMSYTPTADFNGPASLTINTNDRNFTGTGGAQSDNDVVTINVTPVNDAPSFTKGADEVVNEDAGAQTVNPWTTTFSAGPNESGQTVDFIVSNDNNALFSVQPAISATGVLTYTPAADANGVATVTVQIHDNGGTAGGGVDTSASQTFTITVNAVNDVPSFAKGSDETVNEDAGAQTVNPWATAISAGPADEAGQTLSFTVNNDNNALFSVQPAVDSSGVLTYTPAPDAHGTAIVSVSIMDNGGTANGGVDTSAIQTFNINVTAVNDAPSFTKGPDQTVYNDAPQTIPGWVTAISAGPADESAQVLHFEVTNDNNALFSVQPAIDSSGTLTYTPAPNGFGSATVTVVLKDDGGTANGGVDASPSQTFVINVNTTGWTITADSGGTEDESNPARLTYTNFTAAAVPGSPAGSYVMRYNITSIGNLTAGGAIDTRLRVRFRDEGAGSRVIVTILRANIFGGVSTLGTVFDSDNFAPSNGFQTQAITMPALTFDFLQNIYWLDVTMIKDAPTNQPGFGSAQINHQ